MKRKKKSTYCPPNEHTWTPVAGGEGYDVDFDTEVCVKCLCYSSKRRVRAFTEAHPNTMIGRR